MTLLLAQLSLLRVGVLLRKGAPRFCAGYLERSQFDLHFGEALSLISLDTNLSHDIIELLIILVNNYILDSHEDFFKVTIWYQVAFGVGPSLG